MNDILKSFTIGFLVDLLQYFTFAGTAFLVFWVLLKDRLFHRVIQKKFSSRERIFHEIKYSISSMAIFSTIGIGSAYMIKNGYSQVYTDVSEYGWWYTLASVPLYLFLHDMYFYWTHRAMHHPAIFKTVHLVHHRSTNPSPWAAYSFHPLEAVVQGLFFPITFMLIPIHVKALLAAVLISLLYNVLGHVSFEFMPKGFTRSFMFWHNVPTHHNMHHKYFKANYGLYFNIWDRIGGTLHAKYDETFDEVTHRQPAPKATKEVVTEVEEVARA